MSNITRGVVAGLAATVVMSILMVMKQMMGVMPELNPIAMMTDMAGASTPMIGWVMHVMIGVVVWGILFSLLEDKLPGGAVVSGIIFGIGAWLMMMLVVMPMAGAGVFGMSLGMMAPVMTLVLHIIFGAVLGWVYGRTGGAAAPSAA